MTVRRTDTVAGSPVVTCPRPPVLTAPDLSRLRDGEADELTAGEMVEGLELIEADLSGGDLSAPTLLSCRLSGIFVNDTDLTAARLVDCRLECLSATYPHNLCSTQRTVELVGSRIGAWELYNADVGSLLMEDYRLGFTNLAGTVVCDLLVQITRIDELDLNGIDAQRVRFEDRQVGTLRLYDGNLSDVDLRGLEMRTVNGVGPLAGATISSGQPSELVPLLVQHLGLRVTDRDHVQDATARSKRA